MSIAISDATPHQAATEAARPEPMVLTDLADDALAALCERVVRNGEAYWCAVTCHALRRAVLAACQKLKLPPSSMASTACLSLKRLEQAMTLPRFRELVHANMNATSAASARPHSLDRKWVWSPAGERSLAARASPQVLDYAWAQWRLSLDPHNPGCFVTCVVAAGRVDLLKEMDRTAEEQGLDESHNWRTLRNKFNAIGAFPTGAHLARDATDPRLGRGRAAGAGAAQRQVRRHRVVLRPHGDGRPREARRVAAGQGDAHAVALRARPLHAAKARCMRRSRGSRARRRSASDPYAMLGFLQTWMWPRLGSRAPMQCRRAAHRHRGRGGALAARRDQRRGGAGVAVAAGRVAAGRRHDAATCSPPRATCTSRPIAAEPL